MREDSEDGRSESPVHRSVRNARRNGKSLVRTGSSISLTEVDSETEGLLTEKYERNVAQITKEGDNFFYRPHVASTLLFVLAGTIYAGFSVSAEVQDYRDGMRKGLAAVCLVFVLFSGMQSRDSVFRRPHPVVWRLVLGINILYSAWLTFMLFQTRDQARKLMGVLFDSSLGVPLEERSYGEDCRLYTPELPNKFANISAGLDIFIIGHSLGWWCKTVSLRDPALTFVMALAFEWMEVSFRHVLPNFNECWWDSLLLDAFGCNLLGIAAGIWTCRYFSLKAYSWTGFWQTKGSRAKVKRLLWQLTPEQLDTFSWNILASPKRFAGALMIFVIGLTLDMNAFFLKQVLWVPPESALNIIRLGFWWGLVTIGTREAYDFLTNPACKRLGTFAALVFWNVLMEVVLVYKFTRGQPEYQIPMPDWIFTTWVVGIASLAIWFVWYFFVHNTSWQKKAQADEGDKVDEGDEGKEDGDDGDGRKLKNH